MSTSSQNRVLLRDSVTCCREISPDGRPRRLPIDQRPIDGPLNENPTRTIIYLSIYQSNYLDSIAFTVFRRPTVFGCLPRSSCLSRWRRSSIISAVCRSSSVWNGLVDKRRLSFGEDEFLPLIVSSTLSPRRTDIASIQTDEYGSANHSLSSQSIGYLNKQGSGFGPSDTRKAS